MRSFKQYYFIFISFLAISCSDNDINKKRESKELFEPNIVDVKLTNVPILDSETEKIDLGLSALKERSDISFTSFRELDHLGSKPSLYHAFHAFK